MSLPLGQIKTLFYVTSFRNFILVILHPKTVTGLSRFDSLECIHVYLHVKT